MNGRYFTVSSCINTAVLCVHIVWRESGAGSDKGSSWIWQNGKRKKPDDWDVDSKGQHDVHPVRNTAACEHLILFCFTAFKFSHTRYRALGPELIPVYKQSTRIWLVNVKSSPRQWAAITYTTSPASLRRKHSPDGATTDLDGESLIAAHYSFIKRQRIKSWFDLVGWPPADGLSTLVVSHQLKVDTESSPASDRRSTDVLDVPRQQPK